MSLQDFQRQYEWAPITLVGGIAQNMPGQKIDIGYLLQPNLYPQGIFGPGLNIDPDKLFAHFEVMTGGKLIDNEIADYPLANQIVAANANIVQGLRVSLLMVAPAQGDGAYITKLSTMTSLRTALAQHTISGGTYNVATPAFIYTNSLLIDLVDVSSGDTKQVQTQWQWNFYQPLLTIVQAQTAQNNLLSRMSSQSQILADPISGSVAWTGPQNSTAQPNLTTPFLSPSTTGASSVGVTGAVGPPQ